MKNNCRNCHFLIRTVDGKPFLWNETERTNESIPDFYYASCYMGVWDTGIDQSLNNKLNAVINENRKGTCFFMKYVPGMNLETAKSLQEKNEIKEQSKISIDYNK